MEDFKKMKLWDFMKYVWKNGFMGEMRSELLEIPIFGLFIWINCVIYFPLVFPLVCYFNLRKIKKGGYDNE